MTQYAKVVDGRLVERPVTYAQIVQRADNPKQYLPLIVVPFAGTVKPYHALYEIATINANNVTITFEERPLSLEALLIRANFRDGLLDNSAAISGFNDVDPVLVGAISTAAVLSVEARLNAFARTRGYDDIKGLVGYVGSHVQRFNDDAVRGKYLRDESWAKFYEYLGQLQAGVQALPKTPNDIYAVLPVLSWS